MTCIGKFWALLCLVLLVLLSTAVSHQASAAPDSPSKIIQADVVVYGGSPSGVAAAVASARHGMNTVLITPRGKLGGLLTYAQLNYLDINWDQHQRLLTTGIFAEWFKLVHQRLGINIGQGESAFESLVSGAHVRWIKNAQVENLAVSNNQITSLTLSSGGQQVKVEGKSFIDSSENGDLAAMAGAPFFKNWASIHEPTRHQAATLVLKFTHVNWQEFIQAPGIRHYKNVGGGLPQLVRQYQPSTPGTQLRGLGVAYDGGGKAHLNGLLIFGVDGTNPASRAAGRKRGLEEAPHVLAYLRAHVPGFEHAQLDKQPAALYVRESRHFQTLYTLQVSDEWENRDFWDSIAVGSYPLDIQMTGHGDYGFVVGNPRRYAIPFRSLVPQKLTNLLVASRAAGYSVFAAGSARTIPVETEVGQAAGTAAALAAGEQLDFHQLASIPGLISYLRSELLHDGLRIQHFQLAYPYQGQDWFQQSTPLLNLGLIGGGYANDLHPDQAASTMTLANLLEHGFKRTTGNVPAKLVKVLRSLPKGPLTRSELSHVLTVIKAEPQGSELTDEAVGPGKTVRPGKTVESEHTAGKGTGRPVLDKQLYPVVASVLEGLR